MTLSVVTANQTRAMPGSSRDREPARCPGTVLLLGNYRPTIAVARALSQAGYRVISGQEGEPLGAHCSLFVDEFWTHPELCSDPARFLQALKDLLASRRDIKAVLPVSEEFVKFLAAHENAIPESAVLASPCGGVIRIFTDKLAALKLAREQDVPTKPFACVADHASLLCTAQEIGFPITVRGLGVSARLLGRKALICNDLDELKIALPEWPLGHSSLLIQQFATGRRRNIYFAAHNGRVIGLAQTQIIRTNSPDGTGLAVDGWTEHPDASLAADTEKLVAATKYTGIGLAQFIVDPECGDRCFLELNPRVSGSHTVAERAGLPLSRLAIDLAGQAGAEAPRGFAGSTFVAETGLRYAWTGGDMLAAKYALKSGEISLSTAALWLLRAVRTALSADIQMVWNFRDPGPSLMSLLLLMPCCQGIREALRTWFTAQRPVLPKGPGLPDPALDSHRPARTACRALSNVRSAS